MSNTAVCISSTRRCCHTSITRASQAGGNVSKQSAPEKTIMRWTILLPALLLSSTVDDVCRYQQHGITNAGRRDR